MGYYTRSKKNERVQGDMDCDSSTKENSIADNPSGLQSDQSNSSKEDITNVTSKSESETKTTKSLITNELGKVNHNLDVFKQDIRENAKEFNEDTILMLDIGDKMKRKKLKNKYRVICKIGVGGGSLVWLIIDMKTHEFKVAKVFQYRSGIPQLEIDTLKKTSNHPNILHFYEKLVIRSGKRLGRVAIYEPLGKDLSTLMKEAAQHDGLSISIAKKVAKHILMALQTLHDLKVIHSDIKLQNIATSVSQLSLRCQFEKIVESMKSGKNLSSLRMVCDNSEFDVNKKGKLLEKELEEVLKLELKDEPELIFKLIDFGNIDVEGSKHRTGTPGYRPPEYYFRAPLLRSHDIWSLGVTIVELLTCKMFLKYGKNAVDEIEALHYMFGNFSRRHYKGFKDPHRYKSKHTTRFYSSEKTEKRIKKFLQKKFRKLKMHEDDRSVLIDFLFQMFNTVPSERKSAEELLTHTWLNFDAADQQYENKPICS